MRVVCDCIKDFIENLESEKNEDVVQKTVRVNTTFNERGDVTVGVVIQASTIVNIGDEGQYLLEVGEDCGIDYNDATQEKKGSERALFLKKMIVNYCEGRGLIVKPGMISI